MDRWSGADGEQVLDGGARGDPGTPAPLEQLDGDVVGWWRLSADVLAVAGADQLVRGG